MSIGLARNLRAIVPLTLLGLTLGCGGRGEPTAADRPAPAAVSVTTASSVVRERVETFETAGVVRGRTSATLASRMMATVREVIVQPGDRVRAGQILARLDDRDVSAAVREAGARRAVAERSIEGARAEQQAAEAALTLARTTHERIVTLHGRKSATPQELDQAVAGLRAAESRVARALAGMDEARASLEAAGASSDSARVTMSFTTIVAPFDGVVTEKLVDPGNLVSPGTPLLRMEDTRSLELETRVDESRASHVSLDAPVTVVVDGPDGQVRLAGRVSEVARAVDADTRTLLVTIALPPQGTAAVRSGMYGRAIFPGPSRRLLTVPDDAVVRTGQLTSVFVVDSGRARLRLVNVGRAAEGTTEVLSGLSEGESVVVAPPPAVRDGTPLTMRPAAEPSRPGGKS
jgi:multidrug efflux pump subunit AcrA (membrane-fusion protein)